MDKKIKLFITAQIAVIIVFAVLALNCSSTQSTPSSYSGGGQTSSYTSGRYNYERQIANSKSNNNSPYSSNQGSYAQQSSHSNSNTYNSSNATSQHSTSGTLNSIFGKSKAKDQKQGTTGKTQTKSNGDDVEIICIGSGITHDNAVKTALRSAIEQAYGTFVSSNTKLLNDELVADEIVSISSGNIKHYDILSEAQVGNQWNVTVKAQVSTNNLVSFAKSKGCAAELAGATFAMNVRIEKMNEDAELKALENLIRQTNEMLKYALDYRLIVEEPQAIGSGYDVSVPIVVYFSLNENFKKCKQYFKETFESIALDNTERAKRQNLGLDVYEVKFYLYGQSYRTYYLRTDKYWFDDFLFTPDIKYYINTGVKKVEISELKDDGFLVDGRHEQNGNDEKQREMAFDLKKGGRNESFNFYYMYEYGNNGYIWFHAFKLSCSLRDVQKIKKIELIPDNEHFGLNMGLSEAEKNRRIKMKKEDEYIRRVGLGH